MSTSPLHPDDVNIITAQVVSLAQADLPLETGLRAAAAESSNARIAKVLARIATKLEAGESLEQAINSVAGALPGNVSALLLAGKQTGKWREALLDVVEHDLSSQETLRTVRSALAYPLALIGFAYCCFLFLHTVAFCFCSSRLSATSPVSWLTLNWICPVPRPCCFRSMRSAGGWSLSLPLSCSW